jgi:hypothetical protein
MDKYDGLVVQYTHPAIPPYGIKLNKPYTVNVDGEKIFIITDHREELILSEYLLTVLFSLIENSWESIDK